MNIRSTRSFAINVALPFVAALAAAEPGVAAAEQPFTSAKPKPRITAAIDDRSTLKLAGNRHPALAVAEDRGPVERTLQLGRMVLVLKSDAAQAGALDQLLRAQHDRSSPQHGRWLTPRQFEQRFGVATADITKVAGWLKAHGFTVEEVPAGGRSILFSGTAEQVQQAFRTEIHRYRYRGEDHIANASDPQIPAALAAVVAGVASLHDFRSKPQHVVRPAYTSGGAHYIGAADFATIYDLNPLYSQSIDGSGRSIAVLGRTSIVASDIAAFRSTMGLAANSPTIIPNGSPPAIVPGDEVESDLDLEWAGAVAPAATIDFVTSASTGTSDGIDLSAQYAVANNVADIISLSYGSCEQAIGSAGLTAYANLWQQAAAQGISVMVSSGDAGAAGCDLPSSATATGGLGVNGLCSAPDSTCVGGSELADTANPSLYWSSTNNASTLESALSYIPENVWNESGLAPGGSGLWSSGGGASTVFAKPFWQLGPGIPADGKRDVPDVSLTAALHDGYIILSSDGSACSPPPAGCVVGGTSASAPSMAGIMALANQKLAARQGNANVTLYDLSRLQAAGGAQAYFHRITTGNDSVPGQSGYAASATQPDYNQATGLGSVDAGVLVNHWGDAVASASLVPAAAIVAAGAGSGSATLSFAPGSIWPWTAHSDTTWLSVTPTGGTSAATLSYTFQANTATSARSATISAAGQPLAVTQAAGAGSPPAIDTLPATLNFGSVALGSSNAQTITVWNIGGSTLSLSSLQVVGAQSGDFKLSGACTAGLGLASATDCGASVTFTPRGAGARSAALQIADNAAGSPTTIPLAGTGAASNAASADIPVPVWALMLLGAGLVAALRCRAAPLAD